MAWLNLFLSRFWHGRAGIGGSIIIGLLGMQIAALAAREFTGAAPLAGRWIIAGLGLALLIVAIIGTFRAIDTHLRDRGGPVAAWGGYALILIVTVSVLVHSTQYLIARHSPAAYVQRPPDGLIIADGTATLSGTISFAQFEALETRRAEIETLRLDSPGGLIHAARGIARLAREGGWTTEVDHRCFSACPLIFVAGTRRIIGPDGQLGFHQYAATAKTDSPGNGKIILGDVAAAIAQDRVFYRARGISDDFLDQMFSTRHRDMWIPDRAVLVDAGFVTADPGIR